MRSFSALLLAGVVMATPVCMMADTPPARVVSLNLCTDQLAMLVADEGQLISISYLAQDRRGSAMADQAKAYPANSGLAEEIFLLQPDLVVAGRYTRPATTEMLQRLGIPVVAFDPASSLEDVRERLLQMGAALGQEGRAANLVAAFDTALAALQEEVTIRPRAALYYANGYTSGDQTLAGQILLTAGFENVATEAGFPYGGVMPLEVLAMMQPDAVITSNPYPSASRSEDILNHPAVIALRDRTVQGGFSNRDWVCGTPFVLNAIEETARLRRQVQGGEF